MTYNNDKKMSITWESDNSKYLDVQMVSHIKRNYTGVVMRPEKDDANIEDDVTAANGDKFRGIRIDTLKESRAFADFGHGDKDIPTYFDKRIMSTAKYGNPEGDTNEETFAFYYNMYNPYRGGSMVTPLWVNLIDTETGAAPEGVVMMNMDVLTIGTTARFSMGFGSATAKQMCRMTFYSESKGVNTSLGYPGGGQLRVFDNESAMDLETVDTEFR